MNSCTEAFFVGSMRNKNIQGQDILSQVRKLNEYTILKLKLHVCYYFICLFAKSTVSENSNRMDEDENVNNEEDDDTIEIEEDLTNNNVNNCQNSEHCNENEDSQESEEIINESEDDV